MKNVHLSMVISLAFGGVGSAKDFDLKCVKIEIKYIYPF